MCTGRVRHHTISGMYTYSMYIVRVGHYIVYVCVCVALYHETCIYCCHIYSSMFFSFGVDLHSLWLLYSAFCPRILLSSLLFSSLLFSSLLFSSLLFSSLLFSSLLFSSLLFSSLLFSSLLFSSLLFSSLLLSSPLLSSPLLSSPLLSSPLLSSPLPSPPLPSSPLFSSLLFSILVIVCQALHQVHQHCQELAVRKTSMARQGMVPCNPLSTGQISHLTFTAVSTFLCEYNYGI